MIDINLSRKSNGVGTHDGIARFIAMNEQRRYEMPKEKSLLRRAKDNIKSYQEYHENAIVSSRKRRLPLYKLAREIQPIRDGHSVLITTREISIDCGNIEESRKLVGRILENTDIENFIITMEKSWSEELIWHYKGIYKDIKVFIGPSPPNKDCKPTLKANANAYWVCETK